MITIMRALEPGRTLYQRYDMENSITHSSTSAFQRSVHRPSTHSLAARDIDRCIIDVTGQLNAQNV